MCIYVVINGVAVASHITTFFNYICSRFIDTTTKIWPLLFLSVGGVQQKVGGTSSNTCDDTSGGSASNPGRVNCGGEGGVGSEVESEDTSNVGGGHGGSANGL
jgi:hypothetical protein